MPMRQSDAGVLPVSPNDLLAPHENDPPGDGQVRPKRNRRGPITALHPQPDRPHDRPHQRRQQDRRPYPLQPDPRPQRGQQLEVAVAPAFLRSEEPTSELQSLMRISSAFF